MDSLQMQKYIRDADTLFAEKDYNGVIYILGDGRDKHDRHWVLAKSLYEGQMMDNIAGYADTSMSPFSFFFPRPFMEMPNS